MINDGGNAEVISGRVGDTVGSNAGHRGEIAVTLVFQLGKFFGNVQGFANLLAKILPVVMSRYRENAAGKTK